MLGAMTDSEAEKRAVGGRLRAAREAKGLSMNAAGTAIGVDKSTVQRWERGEILPRDHWDDVAKIYGRTRFWLEFGVEPEPGVSDPPYRDWSAFLDWYEGVRERYAVKPWVLHNLRRFRIEDGRSIPLESYKRLFYACLELQDQQPE